FYKRISSRKVARLYKHPSDLLFLYHEWNEFWDSAVLKAHWLATVKDDRLDYTKFDKSLFRSIVKMNGDFRSDQRAFI
ncbi:MAG: hypothetical protein LJE96_04990, partial [Deltaproteobacteria bacterium]|nr:hypothetical protein [Deltaproteobacteria bacterium]